MLVSALLLAAALPFGAPAAQNRPDMFSCVASARLPLQTLTYEYELLDKPAEATVSFRRLAQGPAEIIQMVYRPIPTVEVITDLDPVTLAPMRGRLIPGGKETGRWERDKDQIRYTGASGDYAVQAGSGPVVFGAVHLLPFLAATVDWNRCPSVETRQLIAATRALEAVVLTRRGSSTLTHAGRPVEAFEIAVTRGTSTDTVWVARDAPASTLQFTAGSGKPFRLVSRQRP